MFARSLEEHQTHYEEAFHLKSLLVSSKALESFPCSAAILFPSNVLADDYKKRSKRESA